MREKNEVYKVRIGVDNGFEDFFRLLEYNGKSYFAEQRVNYNNRNPNEDCPVTVENSFDNSLFPPYLKSDTELSIIAVETCRTMRMYYDGPEERMGYQGYRYVIEERNEKPSCLDYSMGIKLHKGMYDVSKCLISKCI